MNQKTKAASAAIAALAATAIVGQAAQAAVDDESAPSPKTGDLPPTDSNSTVDAQKEAAETKARVDALEFRTVIDHTPRFVSGLRVRSCSPMGTFRRGGFAFDREARELRLAELTEQQYDAIKSERMLVVEEIDIRVG